LINYKRWGIHFDEPKTGTEIPLSSFHHQRERELKIVPDLIEAIPLFSFQEF
jgi:hypothetical protein